MEVNRSIGSWVTCGAGSKTSFFLEVQSSSCLEPALRATIACRICSDEGSIVAFRRVQAVDDRGTKSIELARRVRLVLETEPVVVLGDKRDHERTQPVEALEPLVEETLDPLSALFDFLVRQHAGGLPHVVGPGMERIILVVFEALKDEHRPARDKPMRGLEHQPRLADAGFPRDEGGLSLTLAGQLPEPFQHLHFPGSADELAGVLLPLLEAKVDRPCVPGFPDLDVFRESL
jgi:hypothetical protein